MQYAYTYKPLEDKRNDRTYRKRCIDEMMRMYAYGGKMVRL